MSKLWLPLPQSSNILLFPSCIKVDKFYETVEKFIDWICQKFGIGESKELIEKFQEDIHTFIDPEKQLEYEEQLEKEWDLER